MNKDFYNKIILRIREYNKKLEQINERIMLTDSIKNLYFCKAMKAEYENKKYRDITVLLEIGYSISDIEKDIEDLYEKAN